MTRERTVATGESVGRCRLALRLQIQSLPTHTEYAVGTSVYYLLVCEISSSHIVRQDMSDDAFHDVCVSGLRTCLNLSLGLFVLSFRFLGVPGSGFRFA